MGIFVPSYRASGVLNDQSAFVPSAGDNNEGVVTLDQIRALIPPAPIRERVPTLIADGTAITHVWAVPFADDSYFVSVTVYNAIGGIIANLDPAGKTASQVVVLLSAPMNGFLEFIVQP